MEGYLACYECGTAISWELLVHDAKLAKKAHDETHTKIMTTKPDFPYKLNYKGEK